VLLHDLPDDGEAVGAVTYAALTEYLQKTALFSQVMGTTRVVPARGFATLPVAANVPLLDVAAKTEVWLPELVARVFAAVAQEYMPAP
jgi:hypothetical protein